MADLQWDPLSALVHDAGSEEHLAERMVEERQRRGWSQERLAKEMTKAGCPTSQSSISKIERPVGGRRRDITADEALALSRAFGIPLGELLLPHNAEGEVLAAWARGPREATQLAEASAAYESTVSTVAERTRGSAEWDAKLKEALAQARKDLNPGGRATVPGQEPLGRGRLRFLEDVARAREAK